MFLAKKQKVLYSNNAKYQISSRFSFIQFMVCWLYCPLQQGMHNPVHWRNKTATLSSVPLHSHLGHVGAPLKTHLTSTTIKWFLCAFV